MNPLARTLVCVVMVLGCHALPAREVAPEEGSLQIGAVEFPTSGSPEAQRHFLRGVALLHSFGFAQARSEFRNAQDLDPGFALAYWGESLCFNQLLMPERDLPSPRAVLERLGATREERLAKAPTEREKGFLRAAEALWMGGGDEAARRIEHLKEMELLHRDHPRDPEVSTFYALALLAAVGPLGDESYRLSMQAGALALEVLAAHPDHPGAAHYAIHAFDDPVHAPLALPAADRFARIAPAVSHALHMPAHIFMQRGMWSEAVRSNTAAYAVAVQQWTPGERTGDLQHAADWGHYASLQLGDVAAAERWLSLARELVDRSSGDAEAARTFGRMHARQMVETRSWRIEPLAVQFSEDETLAVGLAGIELGQLEVTEAARDQLGAAASRPDFSRATFARGNRPIEVARLELSALLQLRRGAEAAALADLEKAVQLADAMGAPRGPALPVKPAHELHAEVLLELGRVPESVAAFRASLLRTPNRPASLLGLARALAAQGDRAAARAAYQALVDVRSGAAPEAEEVREARAYLGPSAR